MQGLSEGQVLELRRRYGTNILQTDRHQSRLLAFLSRFRNPLVIILLIAATLSLFFGDSISFFIIIVIILLSVVLDFLNTYRSEQAAEKLREKVRVKVKVRRARHEYMVNIQEIVPGDIVLLGAGSIIPADGIVLESNDLYTNESALTGESFPQAKPPKATVYMGSGVISGSATMRVSQTAANTKFAHIAKDLVSAHRLTEFEREIREFSNLIVKLTFFLVIFAALVNVLFRHDILQSILFSLALAVGLTPELLPLIITLNLTKGSLRMAHHGVIVKELSAIQNFGSMDVLCTDKTGTLTEDKISLVKYVNDKGITDEGVLELGYVMSTFATSFANPLDDAIKGFTHIDLSPYRKIDEIPFDFERKRSGVVAEHVKDHKRILIVKGAPEEILKICSYNRQKKDPIDAKQTKRLMKLYDSLSQDGYRVLAVASKRVGLEKRYEPTDEKELLFQGFLAFLDPAKKGVGPTLQRMQELGIAIKIISGDNALVSERIAKEVGLPIQGILTGAEISTLSRRQLAQAVERTTIFARVNPEQKMALIEALQTNGHVVGYMGDGINDAPSLRAADIGVSVDNAVDVAKAAADFILMRKSLSELIEGVIEGRVTFANTMKYLRMSLSSNFGNMFSMAGASLFLPFLPMLATQILLNNLLYDTSQFAIPLDNVDSSEVQQPHTLSIKSLKRFMWVYGILSSVFDFITFGVLLLLFHSNQAVFQTGWFLESIITQILVVYIIRTRHIPFKESRPSLPLVASTLSVVAIAILLALTPIRHLFRFGALTPGRIGWIATTIVAYLVCAEIIKHWFYRTSSAPAED